MFDLTWRLRACACAGRDHVFVGVFQTLVLPCLHNVSSSSYVLPSCLEQKQNLPDSCVCVCVCVCVCGWVGGCVRACVRTCFLFCLFLTKQKSK